MFRNELKSDSTAALYELVQGNTHLVMCTGDHLLTGVSVAKQVLLQNLKNSSRILPTRAG